MGGQCHGQRYADGRTTNGIWRSRVDDAPDVSLHYLHVARGVRIRGAQYLEPVRRPGLYTGIAEPLHDRRQPAACALFCRTCLCAGGGRHDWRVAQRQCNGLPLHAWGCYHDIRCVYEAWQDSTVQYILRQMLPAILGVSVAQISLLINTNIATWLQPGSVTWLSFADRLMEFPTALLGVALGPCCCPLIGRLVARRLPHLQHLAGLGIAPDTVAGATASLGLAMLSEGLVATLFNYGAFGSADVQTRSP